MDTYEQDGPEPPDKEAPTPPGLTEHDINAIADRVVAALHRDGRHRTEPDPLLDVKDVARRLKVSESTVEKLIGHGHLVPLRVRGARRFTGEAVDAYLRSAAGKKPRRRSTRA